MIFTLSSHAIFLSLRVLSLQSRKIRRSLGDTGSISNALFGDIFQERRYTILQSFWIYMQLHGEVRLTIWALMTFTLSGHSRFLWLLESFVPLKQEQIEIIVRYGLHL